MQMIGTDFHLGTRYKSRDFFVALIVIVTYDKGSSIEYVPEIL